MSETGPSDGELVIRAQRGDADAFAGLLCRYQDRIYNVCFRMCANHADAADLTQSTFLKALEALRQFKAESNFYTWLFRIAVNATISQRRAQRRRAAASLDVESADGTVREIAATGDGAGQRAERRELFARLEAALARLDDDLRIPVVLRDVEDMDYAQIADLLSIPVGTVKSRIHRGRMLLHEMVSGGGSRTDAAGGGVASSETARAAAAARDPRRN
ncbi:MAG: RNA polymerase sigma factor [Phycisphaerae bacterium]